MGEKSDDQGDQELVKRLFPLMANWLTSADSMDTPTQKIVHVLGSFAVKRLKHGCCVEYLPTLIRLLDDESKNVRYEAVHSLLAIMKDYRRPSDQHAAKTLVL